MQPVTPTPTNTTDSPEASAASGGLVDRVQAAEVLMVKPATMADWALKGFGPPMVKIGRLVRYRRSDLEKYLEERTVNSTATFGRRG